MAFGKVFKTVGNGLAKIANSKHSQTVAGVIAIAGLIGTEILVFRARPKFDKIVDEKKEKIKAIEENEELTEEEVKEARKEVTIETIKEMIPVASPVLASTLITAGSIAIGVVISNNKIENLTSRLVTEVACRELLYDKTKKLIGEDKMNEVQKEIAQENLSSNYTEDELDDVVVKARGGNDRFYDALTGRLFTSDEDTIIDVATILTRKIASGSESYITYNEFYTEMDMTGIVAGDDRAFGGLSNVQKLIPNMNNTIKIGKKSYIVLDWYERPSLHYK